MIKTKVFLILTVLALLSGLAFIETNAVAAEGCGSNSISPEKYGYTFEQGTGYGRVPGHAYIGFHEPLPSDYHIEGGDFQEWKSEDGYRLFLVSGVPWNYKLVWQVDCIDSPPTDYVWPYG